MRMQLPLLLVGVVAVVAAVARAQVSPTQKPAISLTINTAQQTFKAGTVLNVKAALVNNSNQNISLWWGSGEGVPYSVEVRRIQDQKLASETRPGLIRNHRIALSELTPQELDRSGASFTLKPGESSNEDFDVSKYYDLTTPGEYTVQLITPQIPEIKGEFKSNVLTVTVTP
jgi:hypothetical protein